MVDNENQWEDIEYSDSSDGMEEDYGDNFEDGFAQNNGYDSDYQPDSDFSSDGYNLDEDQEYYEGDYSNNSFVGADSGYVPEKRKSSLLPLMVILFVIVCFLGMFFTINKKDSDSHVEESTPSESSEVAMQPDENLSTEDMAVAFFSAAGGDAELISFDFNGNGTTNVPVGEGENASVATVTEVAPSEQEVSFDLFETTENLGIIGEDTENESEENNAIMVVYNKAARLNPFKPPIVDKSQMPGADLLNDTEFEIIEPPTSSVPDENLTRLLQTQISGILFDDESPSAIVNLNGMDQFVKVGDVISGYKIDSITRNQVQISYNSNSYVASVGELFTRGTLERQQAIVNLENKFAGRYKNNN